jgi:hypothetical protein
MTRAVENRPAFYKFLEPSVKSQNWFVDFGKHWSRICIPYLLPLVPGSIKWELSSQHFVFLLWQSVGQSLSSWHICKVNFVVLFIATYNICCLLWRILYLAKSSYVWWSLWYILHIHSTYYIWLNLSMDDGHFGNIIKLPQNNIVYYDKNLKIHLNDSHIITNTNIPCFRLNQGLW